MILIVFFIQHQSKHEIHILKTGKYYQLKINYPLLHSKEIDSEIKEYVYKNKKEFLNKVSKIKNIEKSGKYDFIVQYQMSHEDNVYHIRLETHVYTGEKYIRDDKSFHYDVKNKKFLTLNHYLKDESSLEKLSLLSYYYIMEYGQNIGKSFAEDIVKEKTIPNIENFIHFDFKPNGFEILFPFYEIPNWKDGDIKIIIPYNEINELLKPQYQKKEKEILKEPITPENRNLGKYKNKKLIAFTFDDGPSTSTTSSLLDGLRKYDAKVTFFVLGNRIEANEEVLKRAYKEGHVIGSHTYNHRNLLLLSDYERMQEIKSTNDLIEHVIGIKPILLRPPYGNINDDIKKLSHMHTVQWSIDTLDWKNKDKEVIANEIVEKAQDGAIVLLHDLYQTSVDGALLAMERLEAEGYAFVTILELARLKNIDLDYTTSYFNFSN